MTNVTTCFNMIVLTNPRMHLSSLMVPQHPQKARRATKPPPARIMYVPISNMSEFMITVISRALKSVTNNQMPTPNRPHPIIWNTSTHTLVKKRDEISWALNHHLAESLLSWFFCRHTLIIFCYSEGFVCTDADILYNTNLHKLSVLWICSLGICEIKMQASQSNHILLIKVSVRIDEALFTINGIVTSNTL